MTDYISRQAAIETAVNFFVEFLGGAFHEDSQKVLITAFKHLPSAQPEQKYDPTCQLELHLDTMGDIPVGDGTASRVINVPAYMYGWKIIGYRWLEEKK